MFSEEVQHHGILVSVGNYREVPDLEGWESGEASFGMIEAACKDAAGEVADEAIERKACNVCCDAPSIMTP